MSYILNRSKLKIQCRKVISLRSIFDKLGDDQLRKVYNDLCIEIELTKRNRLMFKYGNECIDKNMIDGFTRGQYLSKVVIDIKDYQHKLMERYSEVKCKNYGIDFILKDLYKELDSLVEILCEVNVRKEV